MEDAEGVDCLPNATIFEQLALMRYEQVSQKLTFYKAFFSQQWKFLIHTILQCLSAKTTAWNEFSSTMASAIICLATNQKFNFSKYIFESMVKNLDNLSGKFLMYPRFVQVFLDKQLEGMSNHNMIYVTPSHTKKIFGNMRRVGKGFSGRETPLFPIMVVHNQEEIDEAVYKELDNSLVRAATTASSLEVEQDSGNIIKTQSKATPNEAGSQGTTSGGGPRRQETMRDTTARTRFESVSKHSNDPLLARVGLTARVESSRDKESLGEDASKQGRINAIDADEDITLVNDQDDADMFDVNTLAGEEVFVVWQSVNVVEEVVAVIDATSKIPVSAATITGVEVTLAQALAELKSAKPKANKVVIQEPEQGTTTTTPTTIISVPKPPQVKGKGIMIEEPVLQAGEEEEEERLAREKAQQIEEANIAWDDVQTKVGADYQLAQRLQAQEQEELTDKEKNMEGKKPKDLKNKSFDSIQKMFDKAFKRVNTFIDFRTDLVEGSSKRGGEDLEQESIKKLKVDEDRETAGLQSLIKVIPDEEEVAIDVVPLATKPPTIVDWKIHKEGKKSYYPIIRADGKIKRLLDDLRVTAAQVCVTAAKLKIMETTKAQQIALDDALVTPANHLKIGKCNHRLSSTLKSNEPIIQVVLDALKLTPLYKAFQITANVPEIYMQEFWAIVSIHHKSLCFKMNDKSCRSLV
ncbi:hypothetical protein Tco_1282746 [Tanacetum coccineum]